MKRVLFLLFLYSICLMLLGIPANVSGITRTGTSGFVFLELPATARQAALGEAYSALGGMQTADGIFCNPAIAAYVTGPTVSFSYGEWLVDTNHQSAAAAINMGNYGVIGLSFLNFNGGDFQGTIIDETTMMGFRDTEIFSMGAFALGSTYALRMTDRFSFGATMRYVRESFSGVGGYDRSDYSASNFLAEVGTLYYTGFGSLRFATNIQGIGLDSKFEGDPFQSPVTYRIGVANDFFDDPASPIKLTGVLEAIHPSDASEKVQFGAELWIMNIVAIRAGYKASSDEEGLTLGGGLNFDMGGGRPIGLDIAWVDYGRFGNITRFSFNLGF